MTDRIDVQRNLPGDEIVGERGKDTQELHASSSTKHDFQSHSSRPTKPQLSIAAGQGEYRKHDEDYSYDSASYGGSSRFSARFEVPTRDPITEPKAHMTPGEYFRNRDPLLRTASGSTMRYQRLLSREDKVDLARNQKDASNLSTMLGNMNNFSERPAPEDWASARKMVDQIANTMDVLSDTWDAEERARFQHRTIFDESLDRDAINHARLQDPSWVQRGQSGFATSFRDPGGAHSRMQNSLHFVPFRHPISSAPSISTTTPERDCALLSNAAADFQRGLQKRNEAYDRAKDGQRYIRGSPKGIRKATQDSSRDLNFSGYSKSASSFSQPRRYSFDASNFSALTPYKNRHTNETRRTSTGPSGTTVASEASPFGPDPARADGGYENASRTGSSALSDSNRERKYRKRSRAPNPESCSSCGLQESPEWRRGPDGMRTLCNACGLYFAKLLRRKRAEASASVPTKATGLSAEQRIPEASITIEELRESLRISSQK